VLSRLTGSGSDFFSGSRLGFRLAKIILGSDSQFEKRLLLIEPEYLLLRKLFKNRETDSLKTLFKL
jgi:hypothetical protein